MRAPALVILFAAGCAAPPPPVHTPAPPPAAPTGATALHLGGEAPAAPDGVGAPGSIVEAVYDVCLDEHGRVARVDPAPGLAAADGVIAAALRRWSWFVASNDARPCWRERVLLGVPAASHIVRQASAGVVARAAT
ncbi:MAG: hypothetical protein ACXVCV_23380, partial [Polyangia bacterium]